VKREDEEEFLVFGYSCNLFRDDERAKWIDSGEHLIPWAGNSELKVDRCVLDQNLINKKMMQKLFEKYLLCNYTGVDLRDGLG